MKQTKHVALRAELLALAARPNGFGKHEVSSAPRSVIDPVVCGMVNKPPARLFTAFVSKDHVRYFDTPERAVAYRDANVIAIRPLGNHTIVRSRRAVAPAGPAVTPAHVVVQVCPGYERVLAQRESFIGAFSSTGIGRYPFPGTWSDNVLRSAE